MLGIACGGVYDALVALAAEERRGDSGDPGCTGARNYRAIGAKVTLVA